MSRSPFRDPFQLTLGEPEPPSARIRRAMRRGPRQRQTFRHHRDAVAVAPVSAHDLPARPLAEWHEMTPGERVTAWAGLCAWVTWLNDRYELSVEERLPRCWPQHPGLIEELSALRAWRTEIYTAPQPSAQAARYWHSELRQVVHAAANQYAAGCRTGHRGPTALAAADQPLQRQWASASALTGIPAAETDCARQARRGGGISHADMAALLDTRQARRGDEGPAETIRYAGRWWTPASSGWIPAAEPGGNAVTSSAIDEATREDDQ